jgi:hypothetical protein
LQRLGSESGIGHLLLNQHQPQPLTEYHLPPTTDLGLILSGGVDAAAAIGVAAPSDEDEPTASGSGEAIGAAASSQVGVSGTTGGTGGGEKVPLAPLLYLPRYIRPCEKRGTYSE